MNGMKLGSNQKPKNSFDHNNWFNINGLDSEENDDDEDDSGSYEYDES